MKKIMMTLVTLSIAATTMAAPILWDITGGSGIDATVADFTAAGVTEDLAGATVSVVTGSQVEGAVMTDSTTTLTKTSGDALKGVYVNGTSAAISPIIKEYIAFDGGLERHMQIGGLSAQLEVNTDYSFYLWGVGDNASQGSKFVFNGTTISLSTADPDAEVDGSLPPTSDYVAKFSFNTGATVSDTLDFEWHRQGRYAGLNGFAIVEAIPEPATLGLIGVFGGGMLFIRRRFMM